MEEMKTSEAILNTAIFLEENKIEGVDWSKINQKVEVLMELAIKAEEYEIANGYYDKYKQENDIELEKLESETIDILNEVQDFVEASKTEKGFRAPTDDDLARKNGLSAPTAKDLSGSKGARKVFADLSLGEKIEQKETVSGHLKKALELLKEKGKDKVKTAEEKSKGIISDMKDKITNMYNSSIDFVNQKKEDNKEKIVAKKEERRLLKEKAIEQLKELGKEDEFILDYEDEAIDLEDEIDAQYDRVEELKDSIKETKKNTKALTKYEKKGFISRFLKNFSELDEREEFSDEQKREMIENGELPKKKGFFSKVKQAFSKAKEQGKEIKGNNEKLKEEIMAKYEKELAEKNSEIEELENILAENDEQREALEEEKKEKLVEIVKTGKLKLKELQEMIDNEIIFCSNPAMIVAKARVSALKDKLGRAFAWELPEKEKGKAEEISKEGKGDKFTFEEIPEEPKGNKFTFEEIPEEPAKKETSRNSGMDR